MSFHTLTEGDFPDGDLREAWRSICGPLSGKPAAPSGDGYVQDNLRTMSEEDGIRLAHEIYDLNYQLRLAVEGERT